VDMDEAHIQNNVPNKQLCILHNCDIIYHCPLSAMYFIDG